MLKSKKLYKALTVCALTLLALIPALVHNPPLPGDAGQNDPDAGLYPLSASGGTVAAAPDGGAFAGGQPYARYTEIKPQGPVTGQFTVPDYNAPSAGELSSTDAYKTISLTFSEVEIEWLAALIYYEGRCYDPIGKELIAQVAVNRVLSPAYPNTLEGVLKQEGQYGYGWEGYSATLVFELGWYGIVDSYEVKASCMAAAQKVASGQSRDEFGNRWPANVLYQHSFDDPEELGPLFRAYTDSSGMFTEYFNLG